MAADRCAANVVATLEPKWCQGWDMVSHRCSGLRRAVLVRCKLEITNRGILEPGTGEGNHRSVVKFSFTTDVGVVHISVSTIHFVSRSVKPFEQSGVS
jgi:hypothetical protein